jgi:hypothetical protein
MSKPVPVFAARLRKQLHEAEKAGDAALLAKLDLMRSIITTRQTESVPTPYIGQDALIRLSRSVSNSVTAACDLFRAHDALSAAGREMNVLPEDNKGAFDDALIVTAEANAA